MTVKPKTVQVEDTFLVSGETSNGNGHPIGTLAVGDIHRDEEKDGQQRMVVRLRGLWRQRRTVLRLTVGGLVVSTLIAFVIPRQYESTARLMPPDQANSSAGMAMLAVAGSSAGSSLGSLAGGILGLKSSGALFIGILQSRTVQDDIVNLFHLQKVYRDHYAEDARKDLSKNTYVFEDRKSGIIAVQVTDSDPQRATAIAAEYTEELNRVVNQMSTSSAHREREFLEDRLKNVQSDLENAEKEFSQFSSKNGAIDIQAQGKAMIEGAAAVQGEIIAAQSELQGLRQIYTDDNVRVRSLNAQMAELKSQLNRIGGKDDGANAPANVTQGDPDYPSIRKLPLLGVAYADLFRRMKVQEAVFETLTREYELAKVQEVKETPSVKVLDSASIPEQKSFPPRLLIIFLGTIAGFVAGMMWLLLNLVWNETDAADPRRVFALEVYQGTVAKFSLGSGNRPATAPFDRDGWSEASNRQTVTQEHD